MRMCKCEILFYPIGNKNIGIVCAAVVAVAAEYNLFTIRAEHGKRIKTFVAANFLQIASIFINGVKIKRVTAFVFLVRSKDDAFTVG